MKTTDVKTTLKIRIEQSPRVAVEYLYSEYSAMLLGYTMQFIPDKKEAEEVLMLIFERLSGRLHEIPEAILSVYCWLQIESRKIILDYKQGCRKNAPLENVTVNNNTSYSSLLTDASEKQRTVFIEMYINGRSAQEVALQLQTDTTSVKQLLRESLIIMRKNMP
ncbi:MAG: hypothetical protein QM731_27960 [Chitinophagaceae bacterium]